MKVLFVASENSPFAQVGGLSQVISFLTRSLRKSGTDARVFMPKYGTIRPKFKMDMVLEGLHVPAEKILHQKFSELICNVKQSKPHPLYTPTYFLENREYYELRANAYGYTDEHIRFYLLSSGCLEWLLYNQKNNGWMPDIIHAHDWHTGYLVELIKRHPRYKSLRHIKVLFTVHNFLYQGNYEFRFAARPDTGRTPLLSIFDPKTQQQNPLLRGVIHADLVNTVSAKHASEVQTKEFGEGLHRHFKKYSYKITGLANGIDTKEMDPAHDKLIAANYSPTNLRPRVKNKLNLQRMLGLEVNADIPLVGFVGRLSAQKGLGLIMQVLDHKEQLPPSQFAFVGGGDAQYAHELQSLAQTNPKSIAACLHLDFTLSRKMFAGCDILLIPSNFEPGGIVAMEALRYGAVPIASDTGGLSETIIPFTTDKLNGNGFLHRRKDVWGLYAALTQALTLYQVPAEWKKIVRNAMRADHSWDNTAKKYLKLYRSILK